MGVMLSSSGHGRRRFTARDVVVETLEQLVHSYDFTREPGGTQLAEKTKKSGGVEYSIVSEVITDKKRKMLMFYAARVQLVENDKPARWRKAYGDRRSPRSLDEAYRGEGAALIQKPCWRHYAMCWAILLR